jgi:hypothetical protein
MTEMSDFSCLESFATGAPALDAVILMDGVGPELIIFGALHTEQPTIAIGIIAQDAWY